MDPTKNQEGTLVLLHYPTVYFLIFSRRGDNFTKIYKLYRGYNEVIARKVLLRFVCDE